MKLPRHSIIFETSVVAVRQSPLMTGKKKNTPVFKKGRKEDPGNYRLMSLTSVPGNRSS